MKQTIVGFIPALVTLVVINIIWTIAFLILFFLILFPVVSEPVIPESLEYDPNKMRRILG